METDLFSTYSSEINSTTSVLVENPPVTYQAFPCNSTDRFGLRVFASTTHNANVTVSLVIGDGQASYFNTPATVRHNNTRSIQGGATGEYYHLTLAQHGVVLNTS